MITQEQLKELVHYDPETGIFTNKVARGNIPVGKILGSPNHTDPRQTYLRLWIDGGHYLLHRLAWLYVYGVLPNGIIDHIDNNKCNNRISNLRIVTHRVNSQKRLPNYNSKTGVTGVIWHKRNNAYVSRITVDGKLLNLGSFQDINDAIKARQEAELKYFTSSFPLSES